MNHLQDNFLSGFRPEVDKKITIFFERAAHLLLHNVRQKRSVITQFQSKTRLINMKSLILILPLLAISFGINIDSFKAYPWSPYKITVTKSGIFSQNETTAFTERDEIKFKCLADKPWKKCWIYKEFKNPKTQIDEKLGCKSTHHAGYQVNLIITKVKIGLCLCFFLY